MLALPEGRKKRSPEGGRSGQRSHRQEQRREWNPSQPYPEPTPPSPHAASGLWAPAEEGGLPTRPYLLVAAVGAWSGEEKTRCRYSFSSFSCTMPGPRGGGGEGSHVSASLSSAGPRGSWSWASHRGEKSSPVGGAAPWQLVGRSWLAGTRRAARLEARWTCGFAASVSPFSFPQHKEPPPWPASPYLWSWISQRLRSACSSCGRRTCRPPWMPSFISCGQPVVLEAEPEEEAV